MLDFSHLAAWQTASLKGPVDARETFIGLTPPPQKSLLLVISPLQISLFFFFFFGFFSSLLQMASMRRLALSSRRGGSDRPRRTLTTRALDACFHSHSRGVGFLTTRCMMRFVRTRVLQSKVRSLLRTRAICAVTSKPGTSGTRRWIPFGRLSLTALRRISVGSSP